MEKLYWRDFSASLMVLAIGIAFLAWAFTYDRSAGEVPILVGGLTIALAIIDALTFTNTAVGHVLRRLFASERTIEWQVEGSENTETTRIWSAVLWVPVYLLGVLMVGFNLMTPIYVFLYLRFHARKTLKTSILAAVLTTGMLLLLFRVILQYPLFQGLVFGGKL